MSRAPLQATTIIKARVRVSNTETWPCLLLFLSHFHCAVVLGQDQDCLAGCFSPSQALVGSLALVRVWSVARSQDDIKNNMMKRAVSGAQGLVASWTFSEGARDGCAAAKDETGGAAAAGSGADWLALQICAPLINL